MSTPGTQATIPAETFLPYDETPLLSSRRQAGWSAANQRLFLAGIAEGHGVDIACGRVGLSASSAYAFRRTAKGAAFALGWRAATLLARDCVAETLMVRALEGQVDTCHRADGTTVTRHRHDNRLAMSLLARLDRQVEHAPDADIVAARLVAQQFDAFLDLVERDDGPARAGLFLARAAAVAALTPGSGPETPQASTGGRAADPAAPRIAALLSPIYALAAADRLVRTGVATAEEIHIADLDPAARADWTAEQWARAEAAGLIAFAPPEPENTPASQQTQRSDVTDENENEDGDEDGDRADTLDRLATTHIWYDEQAEDWRTCFPPDDDFDGTEEGEPDDINYARELTEAERDLLGPDPLGEDAEHAEFTALRDAVFARLAERRDGEQAVDDGEEPISPAASYRAAECSAAPIAPPAPPTTGCF